MKDQHVSQAEIDLMNEVKSMAVRCGRLVEQLEAEAEMDKRSVALGKTRLQEAFMWLVRSVAKPETFG